MKDQYEKIETVLGERPWDKESLRESYFKDFVHTREQIEKLPGGLLFSELKTLQLSLKIFLGAVDDLMSSINRFKYQSLKPDFWHMVNRPFADELEVSVQRGILSSTMCAMALVDHCRIFNNKYKIFGYEVEIEKYFSKNDQHGFIHSLRRYITHIRFTEANWIIKHLPEGRFVFFRIDNETLSRFDGWSSLAKKYISKHNDGVNVEELFEEYAKKVKEFHSWLFVSVFEQYDEELAEYLNYMRQIKKFNSKSNWDIIVNQILKPRKLNPYLYLNRYLQDDQIEDIFSRPYRSKEQIDRIIELIDSYQICTDTLRQEVYEAFRGDT